MNDELRGKKVAILVENGFEQVEFTEPKKALESAGAKVDLVSPQEKEVRSWDSKDWGSTFPVDVPIKQAKPEQYDGLVLPGGVMNPDYLRQSAEAREFVKAMYGAGKPIAAICHGPWMLIEAGCAKGRKVTSYPSLRTDLKNAGAEWVDEEVVVDQGLVTSRGPSDLPAFNRKMVEEFREGVHQRSQGSQFAGRRMAGTGVD